ncbi:LysM peptidoglycan-binding domain-containing protein [Bacillus sp. FJAT-29814]|uniref:LysM peptidoglycan-binding domain-containing protein n=1 Tax=Bacillus sp. FJAT-29814 TaxID=1729688 RepID=UPI0009E92FB9|nr:LysM peptidoglycan-binding domain-containing protein [Bacillus sp. FJAT-29814]
MRKESLAELRKKRMKERNQKLIAVVIAGAIAALLFMNNTKVDADSMVYTVKKKDTFYSLSKKFHVTEKQLKEANGLPSGKIFVGQKLLVPNPNDMKIGDSKAADSHYTVKKGDTLYSIAKKFAVRVDELKKVNHLQSEKIYPGQKLTLPANTKPIYVANQGDTLMGIAKRFGVKAEELKKTNKLRHDTVLIGQQLKIPGKAIYTKATVVGAADNTKVEFKHKGESLVLTVPYGTGPDYQKIAGQKVTIIHKNNAVISTY